MGHDRQAEIRASGIQQGVFRQRAWRNQSYDAAFKWTLGTARFGLCGVFQLLDDRDAKPPADQPCQVYFRLTYGHTAHRHRLALMLAPRCQCDIQRGAGGLRICKKQFVKISHAEE